MIKGTLIKSSASLILREVQIKIAMKHQLIERGWSLSQEQKQAQQAWVCSK